MGEKPSTAADPKPAARNMAPAQKEGLFPKSQNSSPKSRNSNSSAVAARATSTPLDSILTPYSSQGKSMSLASSPSLCSRMVPTASHRAPPRARAFCGFFPGLRNRASASRKTRAKAKKLIPAV